MKKIGFAILLATGLFFATNAQDYNTAIGLRGGFSNGLTLKHFIGTKSAVEGIVSSRWRGFELKGLYQIHNTAFKTERLKWFFGFGAHVGLWNGDYVYWGTTGNSYTVVGIDGILGLEYSFNQVPINIGIDYNPEFNFVGYNGFWGDGGAVSVRYIF